MARTYNAAYHFVMAGIKASTLAKNMYARPLLVIPQQDFEDGNNIETDTINGHTGVSNLNRGSYRKSAESAPTWQDYFGYGEFLEDYFYLLLGYDTITPYNDGTNDVSGIFQHHYELPANNTKELPLATIYNGYSLTDNDTRVWNNAMLNQLEINFSADDLPTITPTFLSDYNNLNLKNLTRPQQPTSYLAMANHTQMYIGDVGASAEEMLSNPINCFTESNLTINNNAESQACHDDNFGENTKMMGTKETNGSITMPWGQDETGLSGTKFYETEFEAYEKYGHVVSEKVPHKQIWYKCIGGNIPVTSGNTVVESGIPFETLIKCPVCEITNVTSPKSGEDTKDLTMEFDVLEKPNQSYITVDITTFLEKLHIDETGTTLSALRPNVAPYPVDA